MNLWTDLTPVDETYFDTAAHRFVYTMELASDADVVWDAIAARTPLSWCRLLNGKYTSSSPLDIGAKRAVTVAGGVLRLREHFFLWDNAQRRHSFYAEQASAPLFRSFAEDYQVVPTGDGECRFTWTFAFDAKPGFGPLVTLGLPVNRLLFNTCVNATYKRFGRVRLRSQA